jgi:ethanolamine utilization microcompartment shell protein EutS
MPLETKPRQVLNEYFVKNAIPTEAQFKELIDAQLNQADDGVFRGGMSEPLSVVAATDAKKHVLRLFAQYPAQQPEWLINVAPGNNVAGLSISDAAGNSRLFIDKATGRVGIGTITPTDALTVQDGDLRIQGGNYRRLEVVSDTYWAGIELVARELGKDVNPNNAGHPHIDFTHGDLGNPNFGVRVYASDNQTLQIHADPNTKNLVFGVQGTLWTDKAIGVGTSAPAGMLDVRVAGTGGWDRFVVNTSTAWGDGNTQYVTIGSGGAAGIMINNPHVSWTGDRASIRYGRSGGVAQGHYWDVGVRTNNAFSLAQNGSTHRLWIDGNGNVGIGTTTPASVLDVQVAGTGTWNRFVVNTTTLWGDGANQYVTIGAGGAAGIMLHKPHVPWTGDRASVYYGRSGGVAQGHYWDGGVRSNNAFSFAQNGNTHRLWLDGSGNIGINTTTPGELLTVQSGDIAIQGGRYRRLKIVSDTYWAGIEIVAREAGEAGNPHIDFTHGNLDSPNYGIRQVAETNNRMRFSAGSGASEVVADTFTGQLSGLDVADNFGATIRCADFNLGHSGRRGSPGRALVDNTTTLVLNYGTDWLQGVRYYGAFGPMSTREIKKNIEALDYAKARELFAGLAPVQFAYRNDDSSAPCLGFIAEDTPFPLADETHESVRIDFILAVLTKLVQRQQAILEQLAPELFAAG